MPRRPFHKNRHLPQVSAAPKIAPTLPNTNEPESKKRKKKRKKPDLVALPDGTVRMIRKPVVLAKTGLSYPTIWEKMQAGKFPRSRDLGDADGSVGWIESEVDAWILARPVRRLKGDPVPA